MTMKEAKTLNGWVTLKKRSGFLESAARDSNSRRVCSASWKVMKFSRMVSAMAPSSLLPSRFQLAEMNNLAVLNQMLRKSWFRQQRFDSSCASLRREENHERLFAYRIPSPGPTISTEQEWEEIATAGQDFNVDHGIGRKL
jgi:hypothetical protein